MRQQAGGALVAMSKLVKSSLNLELYSYETKIYEYRKYMTYVLAQQVTENKQLSFECRTHFSNR